MVTDRVSLTLLIDLLNDPAHATILTFLFSTIQFIVRHLAPVTGKKLRCPIPPINAPCDSLQPIRA